MAGVQIVEGSRSHAKMAQMAQLIAQRGPNIDEISRAIQTPSETVRYWYKQLLNRGFTVQGSCNYESLGMKRVVAKVELDDFFRDNAYTIFNLMHQSVFLTAYAKIKKRGFFVFSASVPEEWIGPWADLMLQLKKAGMLRSIETITLDRIRSVPMRAQSFDFEACRWRFDLRARPTPADVAENFGPKQKYDTMDLKIIGQLQVDANMTLAEMREQVGARNYKTFTWHYREHVLKRHLVKGYRLNWTGMTDGRASGPARKRRYSWVDVIGDHLSETEKAQLAAMLGRAPFLWLEGSGIQTYYARMVFPVEHTSSLQSLLETALSPVKDRVKLLQMDPKHAMHFTVQSQNYDEVSRTWRFNKEEILQSFESLHRIRRQVSNDTPAGHPWNFHENS